MPYSEIASTDDRTPAASEKLESSLYRPSFGRQSLQREREREAHAHGARVLAPIQEAPGRTVSLVIVC